MSRINLLQAGMQGVDLKSNPLAIGEKRKLRFATNMVFEEGVLKSRPGFRYSSLCCSGQFQGAADFQPTRGLSYQPHSSADAGIALVVRGSLYLNGEKLSGNIFKSKGPVNLFQAENYLIIQNTESSTYWWDGETLTESPGMNEVDFAEIVTPITVVDTIPPTAQVVDCNDTGGGCTDESTELIFHINDTISENPIAGATFTLTLNDNEVFVKTSGADGLITFDVPQDTYRYSISKLGYEPIQDALLEVETCSESYARLTPLSCQIDIPYAHYAPETPLAGTFLVNNVGTGVAHITGVSMETLITSIVPPLPITLAPGEYVIVAVVSPTALEDNTLEIVTSCGEYTKAWSEYGGGGGGGGDICEGSWESGDDSFPDEITLDPSGSPSNLLLTRIEKCLWGLDGIFHYVQFQNSPPLWVASSPASGTPETGYRVEGFSAGPLGSYYANPDGSGALIFTVT